jgi:hypothetical protein
MQTNPQIIENTLMMRVGLSKPLPLLIFDYGFVDIRAEKQFISFAKQHPDILLNDEVCKHIYSLLSPGQKAALTNLRKQKHRITKK